MPSMQLLSQAVGFLPSWARQPIFRMGHFAAAASWAPFDVVWMCGQLRSSGEPARLLVAGHDSWANYLPERLLRPGSAVQRVGQVRAPGLARLIKQHREQADFVCMRLDRGWARLVLDPDNLEVPEWVGSFIDLPEDLEGFLRGNESRYSDVRRLRRGGYTCEVSHSHADLDSLYRTQVPDTSFGTPPSGGSDPILTGTLVSNQPGSGKQGSGNGERETGGHYFALTSNRTCLVG